MDMRVSFFLVFLITLTSMILVAFVSWLSGNSMLHIVLYTLVTMWIMGVISQLLIHNLYLSIIKPIEQKKIEKQLKKKGAGTKMNDIQDIDHFLEAQSAKVSAKVDDIPGDYGEESKENSTQDEATDVEDVSV